MNEKYYKDLTVVLEVFSTIHLSGLLICCLCFFLDFVEICLSNRLGEKGHSWIVVFEVLFTMDYSKFFVHTFF